MNENLIDKISSESNFNIQYCATTKEDNNQVFQDNDSDSSILNLLDTELSDKTPEETATSYYSMSESVNHNDSMCHSKRVAIPDIKSETTDQQLEDFLLTKLPQIIAVEKASIQYQVHDQNYPCLSKSFKHCFNSPVLDLLVVVLNTEKLVMFYQGYFAGIPRLANELINLNKKYWKSLISNNDEIAWEHHSKSVVEKFNSLESSEPEFEVGPVIRCRLKASAKQQFNQQLNYFFVQPCSYMIQLSQSNRSCHGFSVNDSDSSADNVYMVSYINIMRECDTEYALKGSAAASLQKVITNATISVPRQKSDAMSDSSVIKSTSNNRSRRNINVNSGQLSVNISSPTYINPEKPMLSAPLTYPLLNDQQYSKQRAQLQQQQHQQQQQHRQTIPMINNQYMSHGVSINIIDPSQHHYQGHYQGPQSTSTLQYILENRNPHYPSSKVPLHNATLQMVSQHSQSYSSAVRSSNLSSCYLPTDHNQSNLSNCSLTSPTTFIPSRHLVPMSSNGILLSSDQYFRNSHQINVIDSVQLTQPMMTVVRSMPSTPNHGGNSYFCSTAQSQLSQTPIHVINSMSHQTQFSSSGSSSTTVPYGNSKNIELSHLNHQQYQSNRILNPMSIKQDTDDISISQKDWPSNQLMHDSIATTYCGPLTSLPMTNDSISFEIVEEILKAEEAKSENKQHTMAMSMSDNSDPLSFDLDDFIMLDQQSNTKQTPVSNNSVTKINSNSPQDTKHDVKHFDRQYTKQSSNSSDSLMSLKSETREKFTSSQRIGIRNYINQHKEGKLTKDQMLRQINDFISHTLGKNNHYRRIIEYWKTQHPSVDSSLSNLNCSHVVQSPEEGPGISPTEQAAQSTTDLEDDKDINRHLSKLVSKRMKEDSMADLVRQRSISRSNTKSSDASIYRITSTTSTGVLETLLNEHDNSINSGDRSYGNNYNSKPSISSTPKHQLSLDQLLMDDDCSMLSGFTPSAQDDKHFKKSSDITMRQQSSNNKSQPSTPSVGGNMGVLESLLNQKNPSMSRIRQKSTESILKHSKPSRQNSMEGFHDDGNNCGDNNATKKNSLLINLLSNSTGNTSSDKYSVVNSSTTSSVDVAYSASQPKRQRMFSGANSIPVENNLSNKKTSEKINTNEMDVFDFVDYEHTHNTTEFQSGTVTSSQSLSAPKTAQNKRNRKRCYSKEMSVDSDGSSEKTPSSVSNSISSDKKVILTSLLENRKVEEIIMSTAPSDMCADIDNSAGNCFVQSENRNTGNYEENLDFEDIKIDDFDLEHLIDISEQLDEQSTNENKANDISIQLSQESGMYSVYSSSSYDMNCAPIYTMVTPVISISQSDPIVPVSKQSVIRLSDKNSILFSAIQSTTSMSTITVECLDNERERLLKQQQQQKVCMGGKYVSLNQLGAPVVDSQPNKNSHPLSLDLLSKQLKEVGPNVMVEPSNPIDCFRPRKSSYSRNPTAMSPLINNQPILPSSPLARSSSSSEIQSDNNKLLSSTTSSNVNHQQVREGLRLLVSNRSAQNNSKNNQQRPSVTGFNDLMSPNSEYNSGRTSNSKSMIHYHSDSQVTINQKPEPSPVSYPVPILQTSVVNITDSKATNILEDSLVNDVFELEELVNSKTSNPTMENLNYHSKSSAELPLSKSNNDSQMMTMSTDMNSSSIQNLPSNLRQPHHHHHLQHYHHHHPHHHHHPAPTSASTNETNSSMTKSKQTANSNSGLLETLLSK